MEEARQLLEHTRRKKGGVLVRGRGARGGHTQGVGQADHTGVQSWPFAQLNSMVQQQ
jgi:hypothetical protein